MIAIDELLNNYFKKNNKKQKIWRIDKIGKIIDFWCVSEAYEALFLFTYKDNEKIQLNNIDRSIQGPRRQGYGTEALTTIELALTEIGKTKNKDVIIAFEDFNTQKDTKKWLIKNNYELKNNKYVKTLCVKNN